MKIKVFKGEDKQWYWHFERKGRVTADSEGFPNKANAVRAAKGVVQSIFKGTTLTAPNARTRFDVQFETVAGADDTVVWLKWYL